MHTTLLTEKSIMHMHPSQEGGGTLEEGGHF